MYTQYRWKQMQADSVVQVACSITWLRFFDTRRETQFSKVFRNRTMLTSPPTFGISRGPISISQHQGRTPTSPHHGRKLSSQHYGRNLTSPHHGRNSTSQHNGWNSTSPHHGQTQFFTTLVGPQHLNIMVGTQLFHTRVETQLNLFQILPNYQPISSGHDIIHTPVQYPFWGILWQQLL